MRLDEAFSRAGTDKASWQHDYGPSYERVLPPRIGPVRLLEIGVDGAAGMAAWLKWFDHRDSRIVGLDNDPARCLAKIEADHPEVLDDGRAAVVWLDATKDALIGRWDVIIDDGSHIAADQQAAWENLWPQLRPGGVYVIEDLTCPVVALEFVGHLELAGEMLDRALRADRDVREVHAFPEMLAMVKR